MLEMAIVENIQRADLNPIETAIGYQRLIDEVGLTHEALSDRMGKRRSTITNSLRLLRLPPELQQALKAKRISAGHGRALAGLDDIAMQLAILRQVERDGWNVRQTEEQVKRITQPKASSQEKQRGEAGLSPVLSDIQRQLAAHYGSKVSLKRQANGKGEFVIHFGSDNEFNRILEKLRGE
jgi:ParB family chromosome partitioning protein